MVLSFSPKLPSTLKLENQPVAIRVPMMMKTIQGPPSPPRGAQLWPLSVAACHTLGEAGLVPKNVELLYGFVYQKMPQSPYYCFLLPACGGSSRLSCQGGASCAPDNPSPAKIPIGDRTFRLCAVPSMIFGSNIPRRLTSSSRFV